MVMSSNDDSGVAKMWNVFSDLRTTLPSLTRVYLSFGTSLREPLLTATLTPAERYRDCRETMIPLVDMLVLEHGREWEEVEVGMPCSFYQGYKSLSRKSRKRKGQITSCDPSLDGMISGRPSGGHHRRDRVFREIKPGFGYWVSQSWDDMTGLPWTVMDPWWPEN